MAVAKRGVVLRAGSGSICHAARVSDTVVVRTTMAFGVNLLGGQDKSHRNQRGVIPLSTKCLLNARMLFRREATLRINKRKGLIETAQGSYRSRLQENLTVGTKSPADIGGKQEPSMNVG